MQQVRDKAIGTLSLVALLLLVCLAELLLATGLGFDSPQTMLEAGSVTSKRILAASLGPALHQGYRHIVDNLLILVLAGAYVEYGYGLSALYRFAVVSDYLAAWFPLALGFTGSVGASGITFGLLGWATSHALARCSQALFEVVTEGEISELSRLVHLLPLALCLAKVRTAILATLPFSTVGAGELTHLIGAILGLGWGIRYVALSYDLDA